MITDKAYIDKTLTTLEMVGDNEDRRLLTLQSLMDLGKREAPLSIVREFLQRAVALDIEVQGEDPEFDTFLSPVVDMVRVALGEAEDEVLERYSEEAVSMLIPFHPAFNELRERLYKKWEAKNRNPTGQ